MSCEYLCSWLVWVTRYLSIGPYAMLVPKRPHSYEELKARLISSAQDRKIKTLLRMLGYNSFKELIDVFSTKSGTLLFLFVLKEVDLLNAFNEKTAIADYQTMKSIFNKFVGTMHHLAKSGGHLNKIRIKFT